MFWRFIAALGHQSLSIAGGAVVSVGLMIWGAAFGNVPWWVYVGVGVGTFVGAAFQAWDDERKRADDAEGRLRDIREARPEVTLRWRVDGEFILLDVRNTGAPATFRGTIETIGGDGRRLEPMPAEWDLTDSHEPLEIGRNAVASFRIASVNEDYEIWQHPETGDISEPDYGWSIYFHKLPGLRGWHVRRRALNEPDREWFVVRMTVRSQPEMPGGVVSKRLRLVGRHAIDPETDERFSPRVIEHYGSFEHDE